MAKQEVVRIDRSPMNPRRWCIELRCGHEVWVTAARRPQRMVMKCMECSPPWPAGEAALPKEGEK